MKYLYTYLFAACFFQLSCSKSSDSESTLDYSTLPELSIHIELEIEESSDFLPGQLRDMFLAEDGTFIVSDWASMTIVQFESDGSYKREIAKQGQGPGELKSIFSLINSKRDTLLVNFFGVPVQTDVYIWDDAERTYFYDYSFVEDLSDGKTIEVIESAPEFGYFAKIRDLSPVITEELFDPPVYESELVGVVNANYDIQIDSTHVLQKPSIIFVEAEEQGVTPLGAPPFLSQDHIKYVTKDRYMLAKPNEGIIQLFDESHQILEEIVLNVQERTVSGTDLDFELEHLPERFQSTLREKAPDIKPALIDIWASEDYFLMHTANYEQGKEMVLLSETGQPLGKFFLSEYDEIYDLRQRNIYTLHKNPEVGHSIRIYQMYF